MYLQSIRSFLDPRLCDVVRHSTVGDFKCEQVCITWPLSLLIARKIVVDDRDVCVRFTNKPEDCFPYPPYGTLDFGAMLDVNTYIKAADFGKKSLLLESLMSALEKLFAWKGWDINPVLVAKKQLIESDFMWPLWSREATSSPDKKWTAQLMVRIDLHETAVHLACRRYRTKQTSYSAQIATIPTTLNTPALLPNLEATTKWLSNSRIRIGCWEAEVPS